MTDHDTPSTPTSQTRFADRAVATIASLVLLGSLAAVVGIPLAGVAHAHDALAYQAKVQQTLTADYGAAVSPATARLLPAGDADLSEQVTLAVNGTHHACSVETTTSAVNLIVSCSGTELAKLPSR